MNQVRPILSQTKTGMIFRYDFVAGGQIVPQKSLCDRIEKDGWDGHQGRKLKICQRYCSVYL